ncbi:MAG: AMP-binding protein, partial [Gammaproteobacteria bacterium]|nr:AMP-binding protein [Gammaproteobacteria bacterium]
MLAILSELHDELHPSRSLSAGVTLTSSLDETFGLDSLGRAQLMQRLERSFNVALPDELMVDAETPADLVSALAQVDSALRDRASTAITLPDSQRADQIISGSPDDALTLTAALQWHANHHPDFVHILVQEDDGKQYTLTYGELANQAARIAAGLAKLGVGPGDSVALMLPTGRDYFCTFAGILVAGAVPVPIYPPVRPSQLEAHLIRHEKILENAHAKVLVTVPAALAISRVVQSHVPSLEDVTTAADISTLSASVFTYVAKPDDTALLQYTSGSTGDPKGVVLTHANLLANIRAMGRAIDISPSDTFVSWLPLYHDMGLIGAWLGMLVYGVRLVCMSPLGFLRRPSRWLEFLSEHGGTLSAAPNFAYELCAHKIDDADLEGIDLSRWRMAFNGAEPVSPRATNAFCERFARYGFQSNAMAPVYGLAECSLGLAFPPVGRGLVIDRVSQSVFARSARAQPVASPAGDTNSTDLLEFVACGSALPGYQIRIVDEESFELPERREGRVQFQGPSATSGYLRNPEATAALFDGPWLDTGDLGYLANAELHITRRAKDMIIRAGRNLFPYELEEAVGDIEGIRKGCVAVFGSNDDSAGTERVVVLAELRANSDIARADIRIAVQQAAERIFGGPVDDIVLAPAFSVLKTSSGKIRRSACKERYERGQISEKPTPLWWQLLKLGARSVPGLFTRSARSVGRWAYASYIWLLIGTLTLVLVPLAIVLPTPTWRWRMARLAGQLFVRLSALGYEVNGRQHIPTTPHLLVANHASYMDWLVLFAAIPHPFSFVGKAQLRSAPGIGLLLRRLGTQFVEREDTRQSVEDAAEVAKVAKSGRTLLIFPEGTFQRAPGVLPFRMG